MKVGAYSNTQKRVVPPWSEKRRSFCELWQQNSSVFTRAIRIAMTVNDHIAGSAEEIVELNACRQELSESPIVLCQCTLAAFGALQVVLKQSCDGVPTAHTRQWAYLLPQTAEDVSQSTITML
jgi:hypothetical protein